MLPCSLGSFWMFFLSDCRRPEHVAHTVWKRYKETQRTMPMISKDTYSHLKQHRPYVFPTQRYPSVFQTLSTLIHLHYPCKQKQTKQIEQVYTPLSIILTSSVLWKPGQDFPPIFFSSLIWHKLYWLEAIYHLHSTKYKY